MAEEDALSAVGKGRDAAVKLDEADSLRHTRAEFLIPSKADIARKSLPTRAETQAESSDPCIYLIGNSLGLQPRRTASRIAQYLSTWHTQGVQGHFKPVLPAADSDAVEALPTWLDVDAKAAEMVSGIVGAKREEVAVMQTLTANLHLLMAAFYRPRKEGRRKIIMERKAFPSDHYVVETQIRHHGLSPEECTISLDAPDSNDILTTDYIKSVISQHAQDTAVLLLPGIQYYTGQLFDIAEITAFARELGIFVIWDLAHAVGNVPLKLHDWNVDAAAWCSYKYLNGGPGCIAGLFVHERHSTGSHETHRSNEVLPGGHSNRFAGWWGNDKSSRFAMRPGFHPVPGAAGFQLSNPSVLDITSLCASLEVFHLAGGMSPLRSKSLRLTRYLYHELHASDGELRRWWRVITPAEEEQRGAQLSVLLLDDGLLDGVLEGLEGRGVLVDERRPNVVRVAPAALYNTFEDCWGFVRAFEAALGEAVVKIGGS